MRLCIFDSDRIGCVVDNAVVDVTGVYDLLPRPQWPYPKSDWVVEKFNEIKVELALSVANGQRIPLADVRLKSPIANPGKIIGAPINYRDHILEANADPEINNGKTYTELDKFGLFLKANSSMIGCSDEIQIPFEARRTDHEIELAVVIGREAKRVSRADALDYVFGYCIGLDMTVRGPEFPGFRKSADTFSVLGPWVVTADEIVDPNSLEFSIAVNGEVRQRSSTRYLIFNVQRLIEYASAMYTLHPGDVIMTGTPAGVGPVTYGDTLEATIDGIGSMLVRVERQIRP